jgi:hypothetical protein
MQCNENAEYFTSSQTFKPSTLYNTRHRRIEVTEDNQRRALKKLHRNDSKTPAGLSVRELPIDEHQQPRQLPTPAGLLFVS